MASPFLNALAVKVWQGRTRRLRKDCRWRWNNAVRPSRRALRALLRMTYFFRAIIDLRHGEERTGAAGARLEPRTAPMQRHSCPTLADDPPLVDELACGHLLERRLDGG